MSLNRTSSSNTDFINLVEKLDNELAERDGKDHEFYHQFNSIESLKHVIVLYQQNTAIGCGAIKEVLIGSMEIKRMYVLKEFRGKGFASQILQELENWAKELSYKKCVLETGQKQIEAMALYKKQGYVIIENYGQYRGVENSVCFEKRI